MAGMCAAHHLIGCVCTQFTQSSAYKLHNSTKGVRRLKRKLVVFERPRGMDVARGAQGQISSLSHESFRQLANPVWAKGRRAPQTPVLQGLRTRSCSHCACPGAGVAKLRETAPTTRHFAFGHGLRHFGLDRPRRTAGRVPMTHPLQHRQTRTGRRRHGAGVHVAGGAACLETTRRRSAIEA